MARQKLPGPGKLRRCCSQMRGRLRRMLWRDPCFEPRMPTSPSLFDPKRLQMPPSGPAAPKTAAPGQPAATDFRRALAAAPPVIADGPEAAVAQAAPALLPQLPGIPAPAVADLAQKISTFAQNSGAAKRLKKALAQAPAATAPAVPALPLSTAVPVSAPPLGAARPIAAASTGIPALTAVPATRAPDASVPAAPMPNLSAPAPAAAPLKPGLVTLPDDAKQAAAAAPEKAAVMPTVFTHILPDHFPLAAAGPAQASHGPAKSADITRQIAAALPRGAWTHPGNPMLHISLTPETLGTITVKIAQHASGATTVTLTASQPETLAALKQDARHLDQVLTNAGIPEQDRQVNFQTLPVAATQSSPGLGNAGGQPAGGQPPDGQTAGLLAGGQFGPGNGHAQQQQAGTAFAHPAVRPVAPAVEFVARPRSNHARSGVDVIA
jgi:flagellar hook-length control protein FliK